MIVAVAFHEGDIYPHFGHSPYFALYTTGQDETEIEMKKLVEPPESGHQATADFLAGLGVCAVVCGNIGEEGRQALAAHGIVPFAAFEGDADTAAEMLLHGELPYIDGAGGCAHHGGCCCHGGEEDDGSCGCGGEEGGSCGGSCGCGCGE
jgi:predicted Fe-Mo cluster-binding NifX family protein